MGIYLSEPKKEKTTDIGGNAKFDFAASCMQGWRTNMEDAHIAKVDIGPDTHVFGVFDGHGGREVALFVEKYFIRELMAC
jgi:serine/threonine protein phosphatase PrpC